MNFRKGVERIQAPLIYFLLFLILGYFVSQIGLYVDDHNLIFPTVLKSYFSHFIQYNYDNGLFRPLALIYYYLIYSIYLISPQLAHLIPLIIHFINGLLLYIVLKKIIHNPLLSLL